MAVLDVNGVRHHYDERGEGPVIVLLHGGMESSDSWVAQTPMFAERHRVVLIDRRGHGRTPDVDGPLTYELMRDDTIACLEALDLAGAHLVGWSDGGIIALMVAIERADLVGRVVTMGSNASSEAYTQETRTALGADSPVVELARADYEQTSPDGPAHWPIFRDKVLHLWWETTFDFTDQLGRIAAPTLVLAGDDDCIDPLHSVEMFHRIPHGRLGVVPGASHVAPLEQPELVNSIVLDFLDGPEKPAELMPLLPRRV